MMSKIENKRRDHDIIPVCFVVVIRAKWRIAAKHFKHDGTDRPEVAFFSVSRLRHHFRCLILL